MSITTAPATRPATLPAMPDRPVATTTLTVSAAEIERLSQLPRCLGCGQFTTVRHEDCVPICPLWEPCDACGGLRTRPYTGRACGLCDGVGFIPLDAECTLAELAELTSTEDTEYVVAPPASVALALLRQATR
jgi:hypothetical protein